MGQALEDRFKIPEEIRLDGAIAINERIRELEVAQQERLNHIARNDATFMQLGGQIESLRWVEGHRNGDVGSDAV